MSLAQMIMVSVLRNEFNFWNVHGIMNTSVIKDQKLNLLLIFTFDYKYLNYKNNFNLEIKTVLYLKYNHINGFVRVQNGKVEQPA